MNSNKKVLFNCTICQVLTFYSFFLTFFCLFVFGLTAEKQQRQNCNEAQFDFTSTNTETMSRTAKLLLSNRKSF